MPSEKYNKLIKMVNLNNIEMYSLECAQNNELRKTGKQNIDVQLSHDVKKVVVEGLNLLVRIEFAVKAINKKGSIEEADLDELFNINLHIDLRYLLDIEDEQQFVDDFQTEINEFVKRNALINAWPYAREAISSLTVRMGFPSLTIPTYKYTPIY